MSEIERQGNESTGPGQAPPEGESAPRLAPVRSKRRSGKKRPTTDSGLPGSALPGSGRQASTLPDRTDSLDDAPDKGSARPWAGSARKLSLSIGLAAALLVVLGFAIDRAQHAGRAMRGVSLAGHDVGGLDRAGLEAVIAAREADLRAQKLPVTVDGSSFELDPASVGFSLDRDATCDEALLIGRDSFLSEVGFWLGGLVGRHHDLALRPAVDRAALDRLLETWQAAGVTSPPFEGAVKVVAGRPEAEPPRRGHRIDRARTHDLLLEAVLAPPAGALPLPLVEVPPVRKPEAVRVALETAERLLSDVVVLTALPPLEEPAAGEPKKKKTASGEAEPLRFTFSQSLLTAALRSRLVEPAAVEIYLDPAALEPVLGEARAALERPPVDARFEISKRDAITIVESRPGRVLDAGRVASAILAAADTGQREGELPVDVGAAPAFSTEDAKALHVDGLVAKFTTTHGCCRPRVKNIHRIAELVDGVLVKPGETFSVNTLVGERTEARGFVPAPTIVHGKMKDTLGGGVSQFATTFFNAALRGGYEIVERQPHSFYFSRYPMGHEATLSFPKPDVIIKNDTAAGLLIKTVYGPTFITVKLFGNNGGRKVEREVSPVFDVVDPPIEYIADEDLEPDEEKIKERGQKGWAVHVSRTVAFPDGKEKTERRKVTYNPRVRKIRVHPCKIPEGEDGYTGERCPENEEEEEEGAEAEVVASTTAPPEAAGAGSDDED